MAVATPRPRRLAPILYSADFGVAIHRNYKIYIAPNVWVGAIRYTSSLLCG